MRDERCSAGENQDPQNKYDYRNTYLMENAAIFQNHPYQYVSGGNTAGVLPRTVGNRG